ncbi:hypothetical protein XOC_4568 [Xanthomonas oryzae pv. oryzicola BLS256]|uniref:Uncharacterized protein n=1 Tax=Xanthomonas oryzae pv. oryzicola (strain BLS256) TaxID=383407 RepID=G7TBB9_XANOB|nr:hypothetical protein XOC_4568 [Xanthomonas oryzae pv. oryzicola BLS256]
MVSPDRHRRRALHRVPMCPATGTHTRRLQQQQSRRGLIASHAR